LHPIALSISVPNVDALVSLSGLVFI
jgi:hypothetical protein